MEILGIPMHDLALYLAGIVATFWGGSKVPWKAAIAKLFTLVPKTVEGQASAADAEPVVLDVATEPGAEFMAAMYDLHRLAHTPEEHARLGQFTADWWAAQSGDSKSDSLPSDSILK